MVKWIFVIYNIETFPGIWYRVKITPTFYTVSRKNSGQYDLSNSKSNFHSS